MIVALLIGPVLASMSLAWAYTHRNDDRLAEMSAPRHLAG